MTILAVIAGLFLPITASAALARAAVPALWMRSRLLIISLAAVAGVGGSSLLFALSIFVFGAQWPLYVPVETALWIAVTAASLRVARRAHFHAVFFSRFSWIELAAALLFAAMLAGSLFQFYWTTANAPFGSWDTQAIWNLRARFLHRGIDGHWRDTFQTALGWSLPDYPLMLPASTARLWLYAGDESAIVSVALAFLFAYASVGMLVGALMSIGRWLEGFLAGSILLASYAFNFWAAAQVADVPVAAFVLGGTVLLSWSVDQRDQSSGPAVALLAFFAGCAAWTKNEGLAYALATLAVLAIVILWRGRDRGRALLWSVAGASLPFMLLFYFKSNIAPPSYLVQALAAPDAASQWWDVDRHKYILGSFAAAFWSWMYPGMGLIPFVAAYGTAAAALLGVRRAQVLLMLPLLGMLAGYYAAYVVTPLDLKWHITTSLSRLLVQVWPAAVYVCFALPRKNLSIAVRQSGMDKPADASFAFDSAE